MTHGKTAFGTVAVLVVLLAAIGTADGRTPREPQPTGAIVGCVTSKDDRVPGGAKVVLTGPIVTALIVDRKGCFEFPDLAPGVYRLSADWSGYDIAKSAPIQVEFGTKAQVDLVLAPSKGPYGIGEWMGTDPFVPRKWPEVDAIVHLRVRDTLPGDHATIGTSYLIVADVLSVVTANSKAGAIGDSLWFYQDGNMYDLPYRAGDEFVGFLRFDADSTFIRASGGGSMFQVHDGTVTFNSRLTSGVQTWKVEDFIKKIKESRWRLPPPVSREAGWAFEDSRKSDGELDRKSLSPNLRST